MFRQAMVFKLGCVAAQQAAEEDRNAYDPLYDCRLRGGAGLATQGGMCMAVSNSLSAEEIAALKSIAAHRVGVDYWEDGTIKRYRALQLVVLEGDQIILTAAGRRLLLSLQDEPLEPVEPQRSP
jgi:hypothetical protein